MGLANRYGVDIKKGAFDISTNDLKDFRRTHRTLMHLQT